MAKNYLDENILLESLRRRDIKAFEHLYAGSRDRLFILAISIVNDAEIAKDIVQEFFVDFWLLELHNKIKVSVKSYIYAAVSRRALMHLRGERSYAKVIETLTPHSLPGTNYPLENEELKIQLNRAIEKLPPTAREVFNLRYVENLSHLQIANILGISVNTVSNHINRALKGLRKELKKSR